jgi:Xaa-Pro aminopeptidase
MDRLPLLLTSWLLATAALAQAPATSPAPLPLPAPPAPLAKSELQQRRATLATAIAAKYPERRTVVLLRGAGKTADMGAFVQDQDFLYLGGVAEPNLALLLVPGPGGSLEVDELLVPPHSPFAATWDGNFLAPGEAAAKRTGFATVGNVRSLHRRLAEVLAPAADGSRPLLLTLQEAAARTGSTPGKANETAQAVQQDKFDGRPSREQALRSALQQAHEGLELAPLEPLLHQQRHVKSAAEIVLLAHAAEIAAEGIAEAMRTTRPGLYEFQVAATARFVFTLRGAGPDAYAAIVGGGPNGCILHYNTCERQLVDSDLIVMDYAPTVHGYAADVTRTFPAAGKFTPEQRKLVQDVHDIQQQLIAMVKPGAKLSAIGKRCAQLLKERGYRSDHGPCHHVGLAVHDPYVDELAAGMVITVEPGAYLRDAGMGCRIEDTILVTADGCTLLSAGVPSTPDAIEALMAEPGVLDHFGGARK